ncbi:MAG: hypothetical protein HQK65_02570 [Desulfamplus sp.]|nr:hypothetical protein [Desulfamplus sp.]
MAKNKMSLEEFLEKYISQEQYDFKSDGERKIAEFLEDNLIKYRYEQGVLVQSPEKLPRIYYPEFYLSEFNMYIEYYGMAGDPDFDKGINVKESAYALTGLNVIFERLSDRKRRLYIGSGTAFR